MAGRLLCQPASNFSQSPVKIRRIPCGVFFFIPFTALFGAPDSFFSFCAPFILFYCSLFLFLGHHTHNSLLMPRFLVFFSTFLCFLTIFSFFRGTWLFFSFLCPVYSFSQLSFSIPGAPHSQFSSHAPLFDIFLSFSMLSHNFLGFSGHLTLFSLSVPRLSFFTVLFFCSRGTTLTILFSCPAFWYFSQLFYTFSQFSRFFGAPGSFSLSCAPFILSHDSLFLFLGHHTHNSLLMPHRMRNHNIVMIKNAYYSF